MSVFVQFVLQILLPVVLLVDLFRKKYSRRRHWLVDVALIAVILSFVFITARWDQFSYYLRILLYPAFGLVAYVAFRCIERQKEPQQEPVTTRQYLAFGGKTIAFFAALFLTIHAMFGFKAPAETIELAHPLRSGVYHVGGGGSTRWVNNHNAFPPQDYALDIVRLNAFGNRARGIRPEGLRKYAIYGDRVYSPCSGVVLKAVDGIEDLPPPRRDPDHPAGNHVIVECLGVEVLLAHLQQNSIVVEEGNDIEEGEVLGAVGNSGSTSQPHLHIHAKKGGTPGDFFSGEGVALRFNGRFLVRNSLFTGRGR